MKSRTKSITALIIAVALVFSLLPCYASATTATWHVTSVSGCLESASVSGNNYGAGGALGGVIGTFSPATSKLLGYANMGYTSISVSGNTAVVTINAYDYYYRRWVSGTAHFSFY